MPTAVWLLLVVALSTAVLALANRWLRRLIPLSAMLRLSLALPDHVPNRFAVARRTWSPAALERGDHAGSGSAEQLLALVGALAEHDAPTRAHGERVQAYAALIGRELGLSREDADRLSWVALLHDVGKVHVPSEVINARGRPTEQGWAALQAHPYHGGRLVEPLRPWLGDWLDGVEQHHERFDGGGYPRGLAGTDVSLAARVIAVADTYDVITSARSYKKPMSAEQARAEITRCAGAQFDPEVVRAFLSVSIGRLRVIAGPATLLAALPWMGPVPAQAFSTASTAAQTAGGQIATVLLATGVGVGSSLTATAALADPPATTSVTQSAAVTDPLPLEPTPTETGRGTSSVERTNQPTPIDTTGQDLADATTLSSTGEASTMGSADDATSGGVGALSPAPSGSAPSAKSYEPGQTASTPTGVKTTMPTSAPPIPAGTASATMPTPSLAPDKAKEEDDD